MRDSSSASTRRPDEIGADGFSSSRLAGNNFPAKRGGGGGGGFCRGEGAAHTSSIGYPRMSASGESSMHRLLHASGSHPIPMPYDPNFTRKPSLQTVGGDRSSIRSTTGNNLPPSICTRRSDGFCHGWNHLEKLIGTSPTTLWTEATWRRYGGGAAAVRWRRGGAADSMIWRLGFL
ncbi:dolichol-phosphate mannosyltransferase subunit 1 [Dorcoceras hygrometricum]|uniref:Dolichol-phosphate mannosyltransferase subunit 1 n=1 Tax=Dorcoceras hygrometricum TaxID=472368 RepID=A0A2Z7A7W3_9LAMI|nr:dolichol-phosphate mannosyltransferase subunit 1 [Dorcoceras hygrometricum]